jgi:hypothetical protein
MAASNREPSTFRVVTTLQLVLFKRYFILSCVQHPPKKCCAADGCGGVREQRAQRIGWGCCLSMVKGAGRTKRTEGSDAWTVLVLVLTANFMVSGMIEKNSNSGCE